ncbi:PREDICTED: MANSC domain-containing protein 4 [Gavialis gangeticus]|uniref:MANSC domain-containing protein 4 n=1 Tax=Gavialis gangeticus TaxID=94835 RepID=UPI00092E6B78|nr:PREDICTED: MANSC domain-containing protein 4 [Gavialis gangeticus]
MFLLGVVAEVLLVLGLVWESDSLCSPTAFYKNCWIRRFPGLLIDLEESQKWGAQVLKIYTEITAQQCSRACCLLKNDSCNLAVFYYETIHQNFNCLHIYCPSLESCIVQARRNVILYNITTGTDPDLLVFEKLSYKDLNTRSSFNKYERQNHSKVADSESCQHDNITSGSLLPESSSSTTSQGLVAVNSYIHGTRGLVQTPELSTDSWTRSSPVADPFAKEKDVSSASTGLTTSLDKKPVYSTLMSVSAKLLSHKPSPARLNNSKQNLNETKGYSGRNYTSENDDHRPAWVVMATGAWLMPIVLCSSLIFLCCCTVFLAAGCCRRRRGHYRPVRRREVESRQFMKYTIVKDRL